MTDLTPGSPEWTKRITASKVGAILGVSPFDSPRSVWHLMRGDVQPFAGNDATRRGQYLEAGVLAWWQAQHPEVDEWRDQPTYELGDWAAATPDRAAYWDCEHDNRANCDTDCMVLVDAKTTTMDDEWGLPGTDEVPMHYYAQALWAMHVSGIPEFRLAVLHSRLRFAEYVVPYDPEQGAVLERKMRAFYDSLASDDPPPLSDSVADFETMRRLHPDIDKGAEAELTEDEAYWLLHSVSRADHWETQQRLHKATALERMGRAQYAVHNGVRVARRQANKSGVSFVPLPKNLPLLLDIKDAS